MDEYGKHASLYDPFIGPFLQPVYRDIVHITKEYGCINILDICCGTGALAGKALETGLNPHGVDFSPAMLRVARRKYPEATFTESDASVLAMDAASFDAVIVCFALHEKPRKMAMAITQEALRLVRPGGILVVADYRTPKKRKSLFTSLVIRFVERVAGSEHNSNFQDFMIRGGAEAFFEEAEVSLKRMKTHMNGWAGIFVHVKET